MKKQDPHWVLIKEYSIEGFAQMALQILAEHNIPRLLKRDVLSAAYGLGASGIGAFFRLYVPVEFSDRAAALLAENGESTHEL